MDVIDRVGPTCGVVAALGTVACILAATAVAPSFSWTGSALSDLGTSGGVAEVLFNGGLIAGGLVGLPFGWWRLRRAATRVGVATGGVFVATTLAMAGIGAFPSGTALHAPLSFGFYLLATCTIALDGSARAVTAEPAAIRRGLVWHWVALGHVTMWLVWVLWYALVGSLGLAVPESLGAAALAAWVVSTARRA